MIIAENTSSPVVSNVLAAPSKFKIKASAKAFKILSGFYSEPILAIPRELGANAWDSHVKAGNTKQMFEVHAPNTLEPWFSVRDFGTGLSPDAIDTIYTTYFESTKTSDNDSDGCMGLGSKTPFNYTDNFNVTSFQNGKKYVYNCFIDETGSPNIMQIATADTTEQNGLEIKFGVKISDIGMWVEKITRAYEPFRYRPVIKGANITYPERKYTYQGTGWAMRENKEYTRVSYAFMGNYCYPIASNIIQSALYKEDKNYRYGSMLNHASFDFFFNIGDLEVAPNKEQLQYDDTNNKTTAAIVAALKIARKELEQSVLKNIEVPKSRWEAMNLYLKYNSHNSPHFPVRNILGDIPINFNGSRIESGVFNLYGFDKLVDKKNEPHILEMYNLTGGRVTKFKKTGSIYANIDKEVIVYYTNQSSLKKARILHHVSTNAYMDKRNIIALVDTSAGNKNVNALKDHFGWTNAQVINVESLPKPPVTPREKRTAATNEVAMYDLDSMIEYYKPQNKATLNRYCPTLTWSRTGASFNGAETYYYVDFLYNDATWNNKNVVEHMHDLVKLFVKNNLNGSATKIYGINKKNQHLLKVGNWINIVDLVKTKVIDTNKSANEQELYMVSEYDKYTDFYNLYYKLSEQKDIIKNIVSADTRTLFTDFVQTYELLQKNYSDNRCKLLYFFGATAACHSPLKCDLAKFKETLSNKYMNIFSINSSRYDRDNSKIYFDLINFIDAKS